MTGRRIVSIYLPQFAMERWQKVMARNGDAPPDDVAVILTTEGPHGPVIHAANRAARLAGAMIGARVVDARAVCADLRVEYADLAGDAAALRRLMLWARRWCPWSVVDGADGLILETTGADHLFGGEAAMLTDMETCLSGLGLGAQLAVAPTWGAAWALARHGPVRAICAEEGIAPALAPLPVDGLRLKGDTLLLLRRLGLKTIGAIAQVPRLSLTRRFARADLAANPLMRLDQAMGHLAEPVASRDAAPRIIARTRLPEPIQDPTAYVPDLCRDLCHQLARQGLGCRRLHLTVYRTDGEISRIEAATAAPTRDADHLHRLFEGKLERINPGFGFDLITLEAGVVEALELTQTRLDGKAEEDLHLPRLIDRLSARFGAQAVQSPALRASHVPERAEIRIPALHMHGAGAEATPRERPVRLLHPPEEVRVLYAVPEGPPVQFIWRRQTHRVARYAGPERIAPEWWRDRPGTRLRDYFKVEDQSGKRLWIYREGLHDDGRGGDPRWFVHGMFA
ncbi:MULTISPECIES: DNA polymerase Y family protein [unclassified Roseovarius]|uniref:Y-family DNA polymerase n=1 Tax=unclassified Roseovarius TaxID=2614913 RepID=UPI00273E092F|nr:MULTISPECIES: DNA polymerase Y family protein [unclassified Roseovarius]